MRIIIIKFFWYQFSLRLLKNRRVLRSMVTCFGIILGQHLCGVNMMIFYALMLFETTGSGELTGSEQTLVVGAVQILVCLLAAFLVDVLGRRILLTVSSLFMGLFLILLGKPFSPNKCFDGKFLRPNIPRLLIILINRFETMYLSSQIIFEFETWKNYRNISFHQLCFSMTIGKYNLSVLKTWFYMILLICF